MLKDPKKKNQSWAVPALLGLIIVIFIYLSLFRKKKLLKERHLPHPVDEQGVDDAARAAVPPHPEGHDSERALDSNEPNQKDTEQVLTSENLSEEINDLLEDIDDPLS